MNAPLKIRLENLHTLKVAEQDLLFHVPTCGLFEMDDLTRRVLEEFESCPSLTEEQVTGNLRENFAAGPVHDAVMELRSLEVLAPEGETAPVQLGFQRDKSPITAIVLNVNSGCNLSCTYCYKEDVTAPANGRRMDFETARGAVDLLLRESGSATRLNVVFFGGEPLSNLPLIRAVVDYAEQAGPSCGKEVDFSLTTNATLLSDTVIAYLDAKGFGITISIDGPREIHDRNRITRGGQGSYAVVAERSRRLLERYRSRPVGARVTLTHGVTDVRGIWDHLYNDLGFYEVGFAPVTSGTDDAFALTGVELREVFAGFKSLGAHFLNEALAGRRCGFSNLQRLINDLHEGTRKLLPCGAGAGMLAVDQNGGINLCHRFSGSDLPRFGDIAQGIDHPRLNQFLGERMDRAGLPCAECRIRNLCSGGCYHESYSRFDDPGHPVTHYCDLLCEWIDFGIEVYARIRSHNPDYFNHHDHLRRSAT
ncbi:MAG: quinohemoprotein amine dehydrogenase maturation protein [Gammaproteobacteria bacterium]|nr:MAG: quinohemoprotein amine dehydrogenase maturation protein [Gammaproteobacteria bacterium]